MKKMVLVCAAAVLLTGCTKNYKTVEEYDTAMKAVRENTPAYSVEVKQTTPMAELYYKTAIKGNKWKTELSMNGGSSYMSTVLYDGVDLLSYSQGSPYAVKNPALDMADDEDTKNSMLEMMNPVSPLFNWKEGYSLLSSLSENAEEPVFVDNKANMNGFDCRMIKFDDTREACISDKYGIAVYQKMKYENPKTRELEETTLNLSKIDTSDIPDSTFDLPKGIEKMDMDKMLDNISKMFEKY